MSQWGYALSQGAAAAAGSAVHSIDANLKEESDRRAADRKLADAERLRAIEESFTIRAEERKRQTALQQGQTIERGATGLLASADAGAINASLGSAIDPKNPDSAATLAAIRANPEAAKAYGLEEDTDLAKSKRRAQSARNVGDLAAAKEEDTNSANLRREKSDKEKDTRDTRRLDLMEEFQRNQTERQNKLAEATLAHQERQGKSADARATEQTNREMRAATSKALDGVNADIKALEKEAVDPMLDPAKQAVVKKQLDAARQEAAGYRRSLGGAGLPPVDAPPQAAAAPPPAAIEYLKKNPGTAAQFDAKYGAGKSASVMAPAAPVAALAKAPGMLASASTEGDLTKATPAQLWAAVESSDPLQKKFATEELRRRGLLADEAQPTGRATGLLANPL